MGQVMSTTQFFLYGKRHFTARGYVRHVKKYTSPVQDSASLGVVADGADGVNLEGRVVVISGANSGVGKELATYAAAKGATLYMICRSRDRAEQAKRDILRRISSPSSTTTTTSTTSPDNHHDDGDDKIRILIADVGELAQVRRVVRELQQRTSRIDCLVCNAGALLNQRTETSEGHEVTFASHLLGGSYLLSQLLVPQLLFRVNSNHNDNNDNNHNDHHHNPRVIFVTSGGMLTTKFPDWNAATSGGNSSGGGATTKYSGELAYAYAKRGQVLLAERLTKDTPQIKWVAAHPGWTATPGVDSAFGENKKFLEPMRSQWQGAEGIAWLMAGGGEQQQQRGSDNIIQSGEFYLDRTPQAKHIAGPFFTEGSFTKNTPAEVDEMMVQLKKAAGL